MSGIFGSTILEVAIGLFFVYFLLSIICSAINEFVALVLKSRAQDLDHGITNLLHDPDIAKRVREHPLIGDLAQPRKLSQLAGFVDNDNRNQLPSYIPSRLFARALFDVVAPTIDGPVTVDRIRRWAQGNSGDERTANERAIGQSLLSLIDDSQGSRKLYVNVDYLWTLVQKLPVDPQRADLVAAVNLGALTAIRSEVKALSEHTQGVVQELTTVLAAIDDPKTWRSAVLAARNRLGNQPAAREALSKLEEISKATGDNVARHKPDLQALSESTQGVVQALTTVLAAIDDPQATLKSVSAAVDGLGDEPAAREATRKLEEIKANAGGALNGIRRHVLLLPPGPARQVVLDLIDDGEGDLNALRKSIETWFDNGMERVSGAYKRSVQRFLLVLALLISVVLGVDSIRLVKVLAQNAALRAALVQEAAAATAPGSVYAPLGATQAQSPDAVATTTAASAQTPGPGEEAAVPPDAGSTQAVSPTATTVPTVTVGFVLQQLKDLQIPMGYDDRPRWDGTRPFSAQLGPWYPYVGGKAMGLLATGFAVSLGAPFWFDVLSKAASLRAAGPRPKESDPEKPPAKDKS